MEELQNTMTLEILVAFIHSSATDQHTSGEWTVLLRSLFQHGTSKQVIAWWKKLQNTMTLEILVAFIHSIICCWSAYLQWTIISLKIHYLWVNKLLVNGGNFMTLMCWLFENNISLHLLTSDSFCLLWLSASFICSAQTLGRCAKCKSGAAFMFLCQTRGWNMYMLLCAFQYQGLVGGTHCVHSSTRA